MVILKKIRAATLVETLVASAIIVIVFMIASLSLNNIFKGNIKSDDSDLQNKIKQITYLYKNDKITIPYYENNKQWDISLIKEDEKAVLQVENKISLNKNQYILGYIK